VTEDTDGAAAQSRGAPPFPRVSREGGDFDLLAYHDRDRGPRETEGQWFAYFFPIFSRNRFSCSSVQYPQSSRINTDVYGIVSVLFSTRT
jgi:hypothetical protein